MRILMTRGARFLGSHLCDRLLYEGHEVICMDNFFTGRKGNVQHLMANPMFDLMRHDLTDPFKVEVDQIYNLACPASSVLRFVDRKAQSLPLVSRPIALNAG
jgi:UDP-glucuronate decarboxylase